jgi:ribosomal protein S27AE
MSFWAQKLNNEEVKTTNIPSRDLYGIYNPAPIPPQAQPQQSIPQQTQEYVPSVRLKEGGRCPGCGSDKYMTMGSYAVACGECGYHPRFEQSGYGERSLQTKPGEATPARQSGDSQTMQGAIATLNAGGGDHINN